ncbi:S8 family serine peptidase [Spirosoma sp.]|uniref:S8 family serine peptidase n=1 Tax=Spirosoma sp. TaxID=1899569 RepID=UPI003B3A837B
MFNPLRKSRLFAVLIGLLLSAPYAGFGQIDLKDESRTTKLSPELLNIRLKENQQKSFSTKSGNLRQAASSEDIPLQKIEMTRVRNGMIAINAVATGADGQALLNDLQALGLTQGAYHKKIVYGYFPVNKLDLLQNVTTLHIARPAYRPHHNAGKVTSQGDTVMRANVARRVHNVSGAGSKVGVLSDSYDALLGAADGVASGDLPADVQIVKDLPMDEDSTLSDEGRAMAEIVHDVAPGARIAFHTAFDSYVDFANGIIRLAQAGCNIIVDDVIYLSEPFFQDGIIAQAVNYVNKNWGVTYFSSAGNQGRQSYSSGFRNSGKLPPLPAGYSIPGSAAHDFGNGKVTQKLTIPARGSVQIMLQWADPFYSESVASGGVSGAKTDIDLLVYYRGVLQPQLSSGNPNIGDDPYEYIAFTNSANTPLEVELAIIKYDGPDPAQIKWVNFGSSSTIVEFNTQSSTSYGHNNAQGAISVGAAAWFQTPGYSSRLYPLPLIESFSSAGGTPILFTEYGQPIPPVVRLKPEIVAPDGGNTTFFYGQQLNDGDTFPNFFGTSAAAPHAAGAAALLQEKAKLAMTPADVLLRLRSTAIDMDDPLTPGFDTGFDFRTGFGFIQVDKAIMIDGQPLVILPPLYDCATGRITLRTSGGDGTPITFSVPGVTRTSPTSTTGIVEAGLRNDPKNIIITATQNGITVVYDFDLAAACNNQPQARIAANEPGTGLQVTTLGNPISTDWLDIEVRGAKGKPLTLQINNTLGGINSSRVIDEAGPVERHKLHLGHTSGLYFLQVTTPGETKTIKVVRQ